VEFEHVTFDLPHGTFHALQGDDPDGQPTIVLHGFPDHPPTAKPFLAELGRRGGQDQTGALSPDFATQVGQAYANLAAVLDALGARLDQVVKLTVYVVGHDMSKLGVLTENVTRMFGDTLPAQTLVPVPKLAIDPMLFEVEAVVLLD
jgi:enamine deaminase RidA (YjgF/YER057c/UK114 family)